MSRPERVVRRAHETRAAILVAAEALFARKGFAATRLQDIAQGVGIRRASLVYHFRDKRELYDAVLDGLFGDLHVRYRQVLSAPGDPGEHLEGIVNAWVDFVAERPGILRILLREIAASDGPSTALVPRLRPLMAEIAAVMRNGQDRGLFHQLDPIHFMMTVAGATVFFVSATPLLAPDWPFDPLSPNQLEDHRAEVLGLTRRLVGTRGPRPVQGGRNN